MQGTHAFRLSPRPAAWSLRIAACSACTALLFCKASAFPLSNLTSCDALLAAPASLAAREDPPDLLPLLLLCPAVKEKGLPSGVELALRAAMAEAACAAAADAAIAASWAWPDVLAALPACI